MKLPFSLRLRNHYPWLFLVLIAPALVLLTVDVWPVASSSLAAEHLLTVIGGVAAFVHFLYSQHQHTTTRFMELFRDFNARYDKDNAALNALFFKTEAFTSAERAKLDDYFNLCAEEYLFYRAGYVDETVWQSWVRGMQFFASNQEIKRIWLNELSGGSYYGFPRSLLDSKSPPQAERTRNAS